MLTNKFNEMISYTTLFTFKWRWWATCWQK